MDGEEFQLFLSGLREGLVEKICAPYMFGEVLDEVHYALIGILVLVILLFVAHWGVKKWSAARDKKRSRSK
jgi:membrane protein DedA with SNARE-associated domain